MGALVEAMDSAVVAVVAAAEAEVTFSGSLPLVVIVALMAQNMMMLIAMTMQVVFVMLLFVMLVVLLVLFLLLTTRILPSITVTRRRTHPQSVGSTNYDRENWRRGWMSPLSAVLITSRYLLRASPSLTRLAEPQVNAERPSLIASTSAINRACLPLPFGNGWMSTSR